jgi:hypothetical protein
MIAAIAIHVAQDRAVMCYLEKENITVISIF